MEMATRYKKSRRAMAGYSFKALKPVTNKKLLKEVIKGRFKGYRVHTLTLEERATCPATCHHLATCYGNNMPFAHRLEHGPELIAKIDSELKARHDKLTLVRLHVLGDFWSVEYVEQWGRWLDDHPNLAAWGYTHNWPDSIIPLERAIGQAIQRVKDRHPDRFRIRWSDRPDLPDSANSEDMAQPVKGESLICPEQEGRTGGCGDCVLCWEQPSRNIIFKTH